MALQRRSELVMMTGWTFDQLDSQNRTDLANLAAYNRIKSAIQDERERLATKKKK